jgi:hypothetical protein
LNGKVTEVGVHPPARLVAGHARREVGYREDRQARRGNDDARRDGGVEERDAAFRQRGRGAHGAWDVLGSLGERLAEGDVLVGEGELQRGAARALGHGEADGAPVRDELPHAPQELGVRAGDGGLAHLELGGGRAARPHDRGEGEALLGPEVEVAWHDEEARGLRAGRACRGGYLVARALAVVEESAGLGEADERLGAEVRERGGARAVQHGKVAVERRGRRARLHELEVRGDVAVLLGLGIERLAGAGDRLGREGYLAAGRDGDLLELADGLAGRGDHAAHVVDLVAEELDAHRARGLGGKHVDGIPVDVELPWGVDGSLVGIAEAHEQRAHVLERDLVPHREGRAREVARADGRHAAHERAGARDHDDGLGGREPREGAAAGADDGVVGGHVGPGPVLALGEPTHAPQAEPGGKRARRPVGSLLARDNEQAGAGMLRPEGGEEQWPRGLRDGQRRVMAVRELTGNRRVLGGGPQLSCDPVNEHGASLPLVSARSS